ncbi:hypothetical protein OROMI_030891 [Orobanche minor]
MDLWCAHPRSNDFLLRCLFPEKPMCKNHSLALEIRVSRGESLPIYCRYRSVLVKATGKKNPGNSSDRNPNSSSRSGNDDHLKHEGDGLKGNNNKSGDTNSHKSQRKPLDWREFRASLYIQEQAEAEHADYIQNQDKKSSRPKSLPLKWAHPISAPENGCLLIATEKLDGVRTFERTVVLLLQSGTKSPQEGPYGIVINRPLNKKMKHMNPTNFELGTTFADCSLHFGGPLDASMFLLTAGRTTGLRGIEEVIPGLYFGSRNSLDYASALVKKGELRPRDFRFFMGYAGWQMDQLVEEIESNYWYVAACSANLISSGLQNLSSGDLWEEILQLMGGHYSELSRKPKRDI